MLAAFVCCFHAYLFPMFLVMLLYALDKYVNQSLFVI